MSFLDLFRELPEEKKNVLGQKINKDTAYYKIIMYDMANDLRANIKNDAVYVESSVGRGNYADVAWICLLPTNTNISTSAQNGIYIVLLFNKTCDSFFVSLNQGFTNFELMKLKPAQKRELIAKTVSYFRSELAVGLVEKYGFSTAPLDFGNNISNLAKGYMQTNIISKRFDVSTFNEEDFYNSLLVLLNEYTDIIDHIGSKTYQDVIAIINPDETVVSLDSALEEINVILSAELIESRDARKKPIRVEKGVLRSNKYTKLAGERIYKKTDHIKRAKELYQIGLVGEKMALEIEKERVRNLDLDPNEHVKWRAIESDSYGYDIESVDYARGKLVKIYIEVKATKDIKDTAFFVSKNEVEVSRVKKGTYRVFRIFDITSISPKYYTADGEIEENFDLDPITFSAKYKYDVT